MDRAIFLNADGNGVGDVFTHEIRDRDVQQIARLNAVVGLDRAAQGGQLQRAYFLGHCGLQIHCQLEGRNRARSPG